MANRIVLNPVSYHGVGAVKEIGGELSRRGYKRAFIASGRHVVKSGEIKKITDVLDEIGVQYTFYTDIKPNPTIENVQNGVKAFQAFGADCIIAVGGGVVTDLAGFVAGTFGRGVPFINYATTLLAAADASVGGKTAVDTPLATNLIGLFNQPKKVYIDIDAWKTLPGRQTRSGLAETIKHACLASLDMFEFIEENLEDILSYDRFACEYIAENNCKIKYNVVMQDERESGLREVLNLGHTVGRAIETVSDYKLLHGEALSIGMAAQVLLSARLGYMSEEEAERVTRLYARAGLPTTIPSYIDREALVKKLYTDKKVRDGKLRFVLQKGIGDVIEFAPGVFAKPIGEELAREIIMEL